MKKLFIFILLFFVSVEANSVGFTQKSHSGIIVESITINANESLTVTFRNTNSSNYNSTGVKMTYYFEWYLSYKGKRISDYYSDAIRFGQTGTHNVYFWPDEVPKGNEKYITVQFKEETQHTDRRDDF